MFSLSLIECQIARFKYTAVIYFYFFSEKAKKALYMYVVYIHIKLRLLQYILAGCFQQIPSGELTGHWKTSWAPALRSFCAWRVFLYSAQLSMAQAEISDNFKIGTTCDCLTFI